MRNTLGHLFGEGPCIPGFLKRSGYAENEPDWLRADVYVALLSAVGMTLVVVWADILGHGLGFEPSASMIASMGKFSLVLLGWIYGRCDFVHSFGKVRYIAIIDAGSYHRRNFSCGNDSLWLCVCTGAVARGCRRYCWAFPMRGGILCGHDAHLLPACKSSMPICCGDGCCCGIVS